MKKLGIAAVLAAGALGVAAPGASAGGPDLGDGPCASVRELFETAYVYMPDVPEPVDEAYVAACRITG